MLVDILTYARSNFSPQRSLLRMGSGLLDLLHHAGLGEHRSKHGIPANPQKDELEDDEVEDDDVTGKEDDDVENDDVENDDVEDDGDDDDDD